MILLIDNYDSFSYNLVQMIGGICKEKFEKGIGTEGPDQNYGIKVIRNDEMTVEEIEKLAPEYIILSPGPGRPSDAGICEDVLANYSKPVKILGVCLGHQAICENFGGTITYAKELMHGKTSEITFDENCALYKGIPQNVKIARYHSLAAEDASLPECLDVVAKTVDGEVMAVKHKTKDIYGVQYHPESVLTDFGKEMLQNFLDA